MIYQSAGLKIGIIGCRGIPNRYGGFEQFAEKLSVGLVKQGHRVWVYNSHNHPCRDPRWQGVHRLLCYDPEYLFGQAGQFIYDWNCIRDSRRRGFDIILQLGYTSSSVWHRQLPAGPVVVTNMDGLEWQRSKYSRPVRRFLKHAEKLAAVHSHALVADSEAIREYLQQEYSLPSTFIPYGADVVENTGADHLTKYDLKAGGYYLVIARLQPDNHIEEIIRGHAASGTPHPLVIVGNTQNGYGRRLKRKYAGKTNKPGSIRFLDSIFDQSTLNCLRRHGRLYFHGHSSGGTNPSLLEAMAASAPVCAHDNMFNHAVLGDDAIYFTCHGDVARCIQQEIPPGKKQAIVTGNINKIKSKYHWKKVIGDYHNLFTQLTGQERS